MTEPPAVPEADAIHQEMSQHHVGSPRYQELAMHLEQAYRKAHGAPAATTPTSSPADSPSEAAGLPSHEDIAAKLAAVGEPHAEPCTAADLSAIPPPEFLPEAQQAGYGWDPALLAQLYTTAEAEDLVPLVREGLHILTQIVLEDVPDVADMLAGLRTKYGSAYPAKVEAAQRGWALFKATQPGVARELAEDGLSDHPAFVAHMVKVGERMMDASTPGGERRLKAKYQQWAASQAR